MRDQIDLEAIVKHNAAVDKANARMRSLREAGVRCCGQISAQGIQITIYKASFRGKGYQTVSTEIIPW
jgi:hypothetical protein